MDLALPLSPAHSTGVFAMVRRQVFRLIVLALPPSMVWSADSIIVDVKHPGPAISPLLFGHNLEHTRYSVWRGLSAEMLANRKFAGSVTADGPDPTKTVRGKPGADGVAAHWYAINSIDAEFAADTTTIFVGRQSQRIKVRGRTRGGIGQRGLFLQGGRDYEVGLWTKAERDLAITVQLADETGRQVYAEKTLSIASGPWRYAVCRLAATRTDRAAKMEISFDGPGSLWLGAASFLPSDHLRGLRRDVVALLKEMSVPLLRWPGGNFTRDYRWQDGLLPVDLRPPIPITWHETQPFADNLDAHEIGTDEFLALCRELGAEPTISLNLDPKLTPPSDAAAWVQYCNGPADSEWGKVRAARGQVEPYRVRFWSLGNEVWGGWMGGVHSDAKTYAERIGRYAAAMKTADPSIQLIASGLWGDWDAQVLPSAVGHIDLISEHDYAPEGKAHVACPEASELARLESVPSGSLLTRLRAVRQAADRIPQGQHLGIAFDEWNVWHDWFIRPLQHTWSVGPIDGRYAATMLNLLCREAVSLKLSMAAFFEPVNEGAIDVQPGSARLTSVGQVFSLYRAHQGNRLLSAKISRDPSAIDVCASVERSGRIAVLTIVNHDLSGPRQISISLAGQAGIRSATVRVLSAAGLETDRRLDDRTERTEIVRGAASVILPRFSVALVRLELP
jgi:alpha-N-arabinofuranosidase